MGNGTFKLLRTLNQKVRAPNLLGFDTIMFSKHIDGNANVQISSATDS